MEKYIQWLESCQVVITGFESDEELGDVPIYAFFDRLTGEPVTPPAPPQQQRRSRRLPADFKLNCNGLFAIDESGDPEEPPKYKRVSDPLFVRASTCNENRRHWGFLIRYRDKGGIWDGWTLPATLLVGSATDFETGLYDRGIRVYDLRALLRYMRDFDPPRHLCCVTKTGWYKGAFILPDRCVGGKFVYQGRDQAPLKQAGDIESWQREIAAFANGNPLLVLSISTAFAGPLLPLIGKDSGGFHIFGMSSKGKTTAMECAASVWSAPDDFIDQWRVTDNGLEGRFAARNHGFAQLDDMGQAEASIVGATIYMAGNAKGKLRAARSGDARQPFDWLMMFLSTGEKSSKAFIEEARQKYQEGHAVRLIDIPVCRSDHGIFEDLHGFADGAVLSDALKAATDKQHGTPILKFLQCLADDRRDMRAAFSEVRAKFQTGGGLSPRVADRFATVALAGELASQYGVTGWPAGTATAASIQLFNEWQAHRQETDSPRQILQHFMNQMAVAQSHFVRENTPQQRDVPRDLYGCIEGQTAYCIPSRLSEMIKPFDNARLIQAAETMGVLVWNKAGKKKVVSHRIGHLRPDCYVFDLEKIEKLLSD